MTDNRKRREGLSKQFKNKSQVNTTDMESNFETIIMFARFCFASVRYLDLGLTRKQLMCLLIECGKVALHYDMIKIYTCLTEVFRTSYNNAVRSKMKLKKMLKIAKKRNLVKEQIIIYLGLNKVYYELEQYNDAINCAKMCAEIAKKTGEINAEIDAYLGIALAYMALKQYTDVILYSKTCIDVIKDINDESESNIKILIIALSLLGKANFSLEMFEDSTYYIMECIDIAKKVDRKDVQIEKYLLLGNVYLSQKKCNQAVLYSKKCVNIAKEIGDVLSEMTAYSILGNAYMSLHQRDSALFYSRKCIDIAQKTGGSEGTKEAEAIANFVIGNTYLLEEKFDKAILFSKRCINIAENNAALKRAEVMASFTIGNAYHTLKKYDEAIPYFKKYIRHAKEIGDKYAERKSYFLMGEACYLLHQYDDAITYNLKSISIANEDGDKRFELIAYQLLLTCFHSKNQFEDIVASQNRCMELTKEIDDKLMEVNLYSSLGKAYYELTQYDDAIHYYKKVLDTIAKESSNVRYDETTMSYCLPGDSYFSLEKVDEAIDYDMKCIDISVKTENKRNFMNAYFALGNAYFSKALYDEAIIYCKKYIDFTKEISDDKNLKKGAFFVLGYSSYALKNDDDSILYYKKFLGIEGNTGFNFKSHEATACYHLGEMYLTQFEYHDAIAYSKRSAVIAEEIEDKKFRTIAYLGLQKVFLSSDQEDDAILYGKKCIHIAKETGQKQDEIEAYLTLGNIYLSRKQYHDAILCCDIARETEKVENNLTACRIRAKSFLSMNKYEDCISEIIDGIKLAKQINDELKMEFLLIVFQDFLLQPKNEDQAVDNASLTSAKVCQQQHVYQNLVNNVEQAMKTDNMIAKLISLRQLYVHYKFNQQYEKAIYCLENEMELHMEIDTLNYFLKASCHKEIGTFYQILNQEEKAAEHFQLGLSYAGAINAKFIQFHCYEALGFIYCRSCDHNTRDKAPDYFRKAIKCSDSIVYIIDPRFNDELMIKLCESSVNCYKILSLILIKKGEAEDALLLLENCRARSLKKLMISRYGLKRETSEKTIKTYADVECLVSNGKYSVLLYAVFHVCTLLRFFSKGNANLQYSFNHSTANLELMTNQTYNELQILQEVNCEDRSLDSTEDTDIEKVHKNTFDCNEDKLVKSVFRIVDIVSTGEKQEKNEESNGKSSLKTLYHILLDEIYIEQDEIVIILDGPLYKVPFAALQDPDTGQYLSETKRVRLVPSISFLKLINECPDDYHCKKGKLIIGDPLVGKVMFGGQEKDFPPLENAFCEALAVGSALHATPLTRENATKAAVMEKLRQGVSVVHIAAHSSLSKGTIALAPSPEIRATKIPDEEDYMLTMADVQKAQVRAQLVVLSCCHSGRGEIRAEGVVGMCRAFLVSGARAVVASLWAIDDEASLEFMTRFYQNISERKLSASASLQQAMKEMRNTVRYNEPKYWAPFFLMGDDVTIKF